jgi:exonuclease III
MSSDTPPWPQLHGGSKLRANINISTLNMNGLTAPTHGMNFHQKWLTINSTLNQHKLAILALQEMHLDQETTECLHQSLGEKMKIISSADPVAPHSTAGVGFVINKKQIVPMQFSIYELIPGRAIFLKIKWHKTELTSLVNIYAPTYRLSHPSFWRKILNEHRALNLPILDFLLGDFNVMEDPIDQVPANSDDQAAVAALRELCLTWNLEDTWHHLHP